MSYFPVGCLVVARQPVQGMVLGAIYDVLDVDERVTPFGTFSSYQLLADQLAPVGWTVRAAITWPVTYVVTTDSGALFGSFLTVAAVRDSIGAFVAKGGAS